MLLGFILAISSISITGVGSWLWYRRVLRNKEASLTEIHRLEIEEVEQAGKERAGRSLLRSKQVLSGLAAEQLVPHMKDFPYYPGDWRGLGSPIDAIVFDGATRDDVEKIILVEVKTGNSRLTKKQRQIRDVVNEGRVEFLEYRVPTEKITLKHKKDLAEDDECLCQMCVT